jgi:hypothetical protein
MYFDYKKIKSGNMPPLAERGNKMELALISVKQIATMFIIILVGIICYKTNLVNAQNNKSLSALVLNVVNPAVIFMSYQVDFDKKLLIGLGLAALLSSVTFFVTIMISNIFVKKKNNKDFNIERIAVVYSNCGFMGIPLINALIGSEGVFYIAVYLTAFNILLWTHGVILMTGETNLKQMISSLITPCIISVILGVAFFIAGIRLPGFLGTAVDTIGSMNTPLAMIVAGVTIAQTNILSALKNKRVYFLTLLKLIVVPVVTILIMIPCAKLGVDRNIYMTMIVASACPAGASGTLFALRYNGNALYSSELFGVTTFLSAVTIPLIMIFAGMFV